MISPAQILSGDIIVRGKGLFTRRETHRRHSALDPEDGLVAFMFIGFRETTVCSRTRCST